jgi:hypothetical protein
MKAGETNPAPPTWARHAVRPLAFVIGACGIATLLASGGRWSWFCELFVNFRTQYAMALGLALLVAAAVRHWRLAGLAAFVLALNVWPMHRVFSGADRGAPDGRALRVVAFNVNIGNDDMARVAR